MVRTPDRGRRAGAGAEDEFSFMEWLGRSKLLLENTAFLLPNPARLHCDARRTACANEPATTNPRYGRANASASVPTRTNARRTNRTRPPRRSSPSSSCGGGCGGCGGGCCCGRRWSCRGGTGWVVGACAGENRMKVPGVELLAAILNKAAITNNLAVPAAVR